MLPSDYRNYAAPAKINLFLEVESKRADGYHTLKSVMQSVSLFDKVSISFNHPDFNLDSGESNLGPVEKNIMTRMWRLLKETYNLPGEVHIKVEKHIPVGAGLGGGSSDGAAVFKAVADYFGIDITADDISAIGSKIGADVPFCYYGGTQIACGIGELLTPLPTPEATDILLINGNFPVSTPEIYRLYDEAPTITDITLFDSMCKAIRENNRDLIKKYLYNDFEEIVRKKYPALGDLLQFLRERNICCRMSGSGPTVFAFAGSNTEEELRQRFPEMLIRPVSFIPYGIKGM